jgi:hypothetical protein
MSILQRSMNLPNPKSGPSFNPTANPKGVFRVMKGRVIMNNLLDDINFGVVLTAIATGIFIATQQLI